MVVLVSFWDGLFSGAMLVSGRVPFRSLTASFPLKSYLLLNRKPDRLPSMMAFRGELLNFGRVFFFGVGNQPSNLRYPRNDGKRRVKFVGR